MSVRKARAWATFTTALIFLLVTVAVGVLTMTEYRYNNHPLPKVPEAEGYLHSVIVGVTFEDEIVRYALVLSDAEPFVRDIDGVPTVCWPSADDANYRAFDYLPEGDEDGDWTESEGFQDAAEGFGEGWHLTIEHRWVWSNNNIYDEEGNLVYEGTDAVIVRPTFCLRSWLAFYLLGLVSKPTLPDSTGKQPSEQPTAYSYNGVVLPDIETVYTPEMQETHPFAVISEHESSAIYLTVCDKELYQNGKYLSTLHKDPDTGSTGGTGTSSFMRWIYNADANTWDIEISDGSQSRTMAVGLAIWANNDVFYRYDVEDVGGTLYLAASEPVPVGGGADNPVQGALLSSDGYTLMDSNGTYLITKENE